MSDKNDVPKRLKLYWYKFKGKVNWTSNENCCSFPGGLPSEYILKSEADKKIQKAYDKGYGDAVES